MIRPSFSCVTQATVVVSNTPLGLGGQGGGGAPSASMVLFDQGADATASANVELFDGGHGGGGAPSATRELLGFGHGGGGAPSAVKARLLSMEWISVKAANNTKAVNATVVIRFIRFSLLVDVRGDPWATTPTQRCFKKG